MVVTWVVHKVVLLLSIWNEFYVMHMKKRSAQVIQACDNLVHFDTMYFCKLAQEEHLCQLRNLHQLLTVDYRKHTVMNYFSL